MTLSKELFLVSVILNAQRSKRIVREAETSVDMGTAAGNKCNLPSFDKC